MKTHKKLEIPGDALRDLTVSTNLIADSFLSEIVKGLFKSVILPLLFFWDLIANIGKIIKFLQLENKNLENTASLLVSLLALLLTGSALVAFFIGYPFVVGLCFVAAVGLGVIYNSGLFIHNVYKFFQTSSKASNKYLKDIHTRNIRHYGVAALVGIAVLSSIVIGVFFVPVLAPIISTVVGVGGGIVLLIGGIYTFIKAIKAERVGIKNVNNGLAEVPVLDREKLLEELFKLLRKIEHTKEKTAKFSEFEKERFNLITKMTVYLLLNNKNLAEYKDEIRTIQNNIGVVSNGLFYNRLIFEYKEYQKHYSSSAYPTNEYFDLIKKLQVNHTKDLFIKDLFNSFKHYQLINQIYLETPSYHDSSSLSANYSYYSIDDLSKRMTEKLEKNRNILLEAIFNKLIVLQTQIDKNKGKVNAWLQEEKRLEKIDILLYLAASLLPLNDRLALDKIKEIESQIGKALPDPSSSNSLFKKLILQFQKINLKLDESEETKSFHVSYINREIFLKNINQLQKKSRIFQSFLKDVSQTKTIFNAVNKHFNIQQIIAERNIKFSDFNDNHFNNLEDLIGH